MTEKAGKNRSDYKRVNRGLVLKMVATGQYTTRAELVRGTGLSKMAISNIVSEMLRQDLLIETETVQSEELGRRPMSLALSPKAPKIIGLVIHRDRCEAILCDLSLQILRREIALIGEDMDQEKLIHMIYQLLDTVLLNAEKVLAIGVAAVGPVSKQEGKILAPFYFYGIHDLEIVKIIKERYGLPVFFDHDNQSAVLAEYLYGNGRGYKDVLFVGISSGVGCGIVSNGQLFANMRGLPPEFGHVSIDVNGRPCQCGNRGCIETYLRTPELLSKLRYHTGKFYTYETFCKMQGDETVERVFRDAMIRLAVALTSTVNILNSELILLGNDSVFWSDRHLQLVEDLVNERRFVAWDRRILVRRSYFMKDAALMGAACNAALHIFNGNLLFDE